MYEAKEEIEDLGIIYLYSYSASSLSWAAS